MQQPDFIYLARGVAGEVTQDEIGNTIVQLRPQIQLKHNYKKKNLMTILFTEDQSMFCIPTRKDLESIYRLHLENKDLTQILRAYCEQQLEKL